MTDVRYQSVLHKRHGWIDAPPGAFFALSKSGKSVELHEPNRDESRLYRYPFGTTFRMTSLYAFDEVATP